MGVAFLVLMIFFFAVENDFDTRECEIFHKVLFLSLELPPEPLLGGSGS
jgi:hypothetical protein